MTRTSPIFAPILLAYILCINKALYSIENPNPSPSKLLEDQAKSLPPDNEHLFERLFSQHYNSLDRLLSFDIELSFIYMQRNWHQLWNELLTTLSPPFSSAFLYIDQPIPTDTQKNSIATVPIIQGQDCTSDCLVDCCCQLERICSTITVRHIEPGGIGYCNGYTTLEGLFFPFCSTSNVWQFIDLRLHYFNNNEWAGNIGVGSRFFKPCINVAYEVNAYFDFRTNCHRKFFFPEVGIGWARLSPCWDLRVNGYFPFARTKTVKRCHFDYPGGFFIDRHKHQVALMGCDLEIGKSLIRCNCFEFYGAIGSYFYGRVDCVKSFVGGRARAVLSMTPYFSLEGIATYDRRYKAKFQGSFAINIPFGCCPKEGFCQDLLSQRIRRNEIIVIDNFCKWKTNF